MLIGIDIGGSHIGVGIVEEEKIIKKVEKELKSFNKTEEDLAEILSKLIYQLVGSKVNEIELIGISSPGIIINGEAFNVNNIGLKQINYKELLKNEFLGAEIIVRNDSKCAVMAEKKYGVLKNVENAVMFTIGTGIGGAIIYKNELLEGTNSSGFEMGHMVINKNGNKCSCGKIGCFEAEASMQVFKREIKDCLCITKELKGEDYVSLLKKNYEILEDIVNNFVDKLCIGISNVCNMFEPDVVVLGGSITFFEEFILEKLNNNILNYLFNKAKVPVIKMAKFQNDSGIIGATIFK